METKRKSTLGVWIFLSVLIIIIAFFGLVGWAKAAAPNQPTNDPTALSTCESPYTSEENSANLDLEYPAATGYDPSADYAALSDAGKGIQACEAQYDN